MTPPLDRDTARLFRHVEAWARLAHPRLMFWALRSRRVFGPVPPLANPRTVNAKFTWRKLFDHDPRFRLVADKLAVKDFCAAIRPDLPAPEVLWVGTDPAAIPDSVLAGDVVVKTNHGWGGHVFIRDGVHDRARMERAIRASLARGWGRTAHEWAYFGLPRRVFVERMVPGGPRLEEVKFYTYGRRIEQIFRTLDRQGDARAQVRMPDGRGEFALTDADTYVVKTRHDWPLPQNWDDMVAAARDIGGQFDHMRVDFLSDGTRAWLGELTVYCQGGLNIEFGQDLSHGMARAWDLRRSWFLTTPQPGWKGEYAEALRRLLDAEAASAPSLPPA
jgi:hypothetical protein